ncbi:hypothetical protein ACFQFG_06095 [Methylobacterium persicinum]
MQIGLSPRDLATLSQMRPADTAPAATGMPSAPAEAVTPGSQASQVAPGGTVPATTPVLRVDPDPAPVPPLGSTAASAPVVIDGRSAPTVASPPPPGPAVSIDPAPATQATEGAAPAVQAREAAQASVGVQHPDTASRARSIRRPSPAPAIARPRTPARDADQTASIGRHRAVGPRLVAHPRASLGRGQPDAGQPASSPPASSGSWTLPPPSRRRISPRPPVTAHPQKERPAMPIRSILFLAVTAALAGPALAQEAPTAPPDTAATWQKPWNLLPMGPESAPADQRNILSMVPGTGLVMGTSSALGTIGQPLPAAPAGTAPSRPAATPSWPRRASMV